MSDMAMRPTVIPGTTRPGMAMRTRTLACDRGLSLVEVTIMLTILMILAAALIPVMTDSVRSARFVAARSDLAQLAAALTNFQRDVGPIVFDGSRLQQPQTTSSLRIVDVLMSQGEMPEVADGVPVETLAPDLRIDASVGTAAAALLPWLSSASVDRMDDHLRTNGRGYIESKSGADRGWNGPYITKEVTGDPWGHRYLINTGFLRGQPQRAGRCSRCAVFVISAGPNGRIETPFQQPISNANVFGDDLAVRIQ